MTLLIILSTFASILDFFQHAFNSIISRACSSDVSVHFFDKSSCAVLVRFDALDKFYKMTFYFVNFFVRFTIFIMYFCYRIITFVDCAHWYDFAREKDT